MNLFNINTSFEGVIKIIKYITYPIKKLFTLVIKKITNNADVKGLTKAEKDIIKKFYSKSLEEFTLSGQTISFNDSETKNIVDKLSRRKILKPMSKVEQIMAYNGSGVVYNLNPNALKKLNKSKVKNEIVIENL